MPDDSTPYSRHPVSPGDARAYLSKSKAWLEAAVESLDACRWDVAAGSAVTAGISPSDAITGALVGQHAGGEHVEALSLLATAGDNGRYAGRQLSQLVAIQDPCPISPRLPLPEGDAEKRWSWPGGSPTEPPPWSSEDALGIDLEWQAHRVFERHFGADDGIRTRDRHLGNQSRPIRRTWLYVDQCSKYWPITTDHDSP